jgi:hypothetical protein
VWNGKISEHVSNSGASGSGQEIMNVLGSGMHADDRERSTQKTESSRPAADENEPMLYCPVCSTRLSELKCKLICDKCGYYMSCADYY